MLRANGKSVFIYFMFFSSPGCFLLVSLIIAVTAAALCELERLRLAEASRKEKEFNQIVKALKRSEEEEVKACISFTPVFLDLEGFSLKLLLELKQCADKPLYQYTHRRQRQRVTTTARKAKSHNKPKEVHKGVLSGRKWHPRHPAISLA